MKIEIPSFEKVISSLRFKRFCRESDYYTDQSGLRPDLLIGCRNCGAEVKNDLYVRDVTRLIEDMRNKCDITLYKQIYFDIATQMQHYAEGN
jgi:hypothetical protein